MLKKVKKLFSKNELKKLLGITVFSIIISLSEVVGLSTVVPFMAIVTNQNIIFENKYLELIYNFFSFESIKSFIFYFGIAIIIIFLIKNILNIFFNYILVSFSRNSYYQFTCKLMENYLKYPYPFWPYFHRKLLLVFQSFLLSVLCFQLSPYSDWHRISL